MAEYTEVIKQFKRMCEWGNCSTATGCPMNPSHNIGQCRKIAFEKPEHFAATVMRWAAEHPEPVYPMWWEWLLDKEVVDVALTPDCFGGIITEIKSSGKMYEHIPADIAEKLGIEPKEG